MRKLFATLLLLLPATLAAQNDTARKAASLFAADSTALDSAQGSAQLPQFFFTNTADSVSVPSFIGRQIRYRAAYDFIRYDQNYIQWRRPQAVKYFFSALAQAATRKVKVVHIGDSHVQADIYTGYVRNRLQEVFGIGGRGLVFPYSAARTHPPYDYHTGYQGQWLWARNIQPAPMVELGLMGVSIRTQDAGAGFRLAFTDSTVLLDNTVLKIFYRPTQKNFDLSVVYDPAQPPLPLQPQLADKRLPYLQAELPYPPKRLDVWMRKNTADQEQFELHGLSLETPADRGMLYHSVGVNGANFTSILRESLMPYHLQSIQPDLVVIDISGNEYWGMIFNEADFEAKLRGVINLVRGASPLASILVSCSQDIYYGYQNVAACGPAAAVARRVAFDMDCAFYDYFAVAGGQYSMLKWLQYRLAKWDRVHLTNEGYIVKGELFSNALLAGYYNALKGREQLIDTMAKTNPLAATLPVPPAMPIPFKEPPKIPYATPQGTMLVYTVKSGDVLGTIAERHRVGVTAIRYWNNLYGNIIYPGQKLVLYVADAVAKQTARPAAKKAVPANITAAAPAKKQAHKNAGTKTTSKTYVVQRGDSLWTIAKKFRTSVDTLKELNDLASESLRPGQRLQVPQ
jgi:LysM repeat protein/lysophospholipase L1-like esterase